MRIVRVLMITGFYSQNPHVDGYQRNLANRQGGKKGSHAR